MNIEANSPLEYIEKIPEDRKLHFAKLREVILENIPKGFEEEVSYGINYMVPHSIYPAGYHCDPKSPLPYIAIASQKNFIALYNMGIYAVPEIYEWFINEFPKHSKKKLDMGKSCIRFKKPEDMPFELIGELVAKLTVEQWIEVYEKNLKR